VDRNRDKTTETETKISDDEATGDVSPRWARVERVLSAVQAHRELLELLADHAVAIDLLRFCDDDVELALRWLHVPASPDTLLLLARCGLEPEHLSRNVIYNGAPTPLFLLTDQLLMVLTDQSSRDKLFASAGAPAIHRCGGGWSEATRPDGTDGWVCDGCGFFLPRVPRVTPPEDARWWVE